MKNFSDYDGFIKLLNDNGVYTGKTVNHFKWYQSSDYVYTSERVGGLSGGSCWGGNPQPFEGEQPSYEDFHKIVDILFEGEDEAELIKRCDEIYAMVQEEEYSNYEYYGNRSDYKYLILDLKSYFENILTIKQLRKMKINMIFGDESI